VVTKIRIQLTLKRTLLTSKSVIFSQGFGYKNKSFGSTETIFGLKRQFLRKAKSGENAKTSKKENCAHSILLNSSIQLS